MDKNILKRTESPKQAKPNDPIKKTGLNPDHRTQTNSNNK